MYSWVCKNERHSTTTSVQFYEAKKATFFILLVFCLGATPENALES